VTGRTHQLRVHLRWLGHPILGDPLYAGRARGPAPRLLLHARRLSIRLPVDQQPRTFTAPWPPDFAPPSPRQDDAA
jgi:23S rRNA-/tRNA-specific pseudouridylate synthase